MAVFPLGNRMGWNTGRCRSDWVGGGRPGKGHPGVFKNDKIAFRDRIRTAHAIAIAMHGQSIQAFMPLYAIWGCISLYCNDFVILIQHYGPFPEHSHRVRHIERWSFYAFDLELCEINAGLSITPFPHSFPHTLLGPSLLASKLPLPSLENSLYAH